MAVDAIIVGAGQHCCPGWSASAQPRNLSNKQDGEFGGDGMNQVVAPMAE